MKPKQKRLHVRKQQKEAATHTTKVEPLVEAPKSESSPSKKKPFFRTKK